jgi:drug/metabolite transporter (DMT)-like permease
LTRRSAVELNLVTYLVPVVAAAAGWYLFGERLSPSMVGGFGLVVVGFALLKRRAIRDVLSRHRIADRG